MSERIIKLEEIYATVKWPGITYTPEELTKLRKALIRTLLCWINTGHATDAIERQHRETLAAMRELFNPSGVTAIKRYNKTTKTAHGGYDLNDFFSKEYKSSVKREVHAVLAAINEATGLNLQGMADLYEEFPFEEQDDDYEEGKWDMY